MMRLTLFETLGTPCSLALDKVLHVLTAPQIFRLPLLRPAFIGGVVYQGQVVPLLAGETFAGRDRESNSPPAFVLVCEAEYGLVAVPADKVIRITKTGEVSSEAISENGSQGEKCEINGRYYHPLDLNRVLEDPVLTVAG